MRFLSKHIIIVILIVGFLLRLWFLVVNDSHSTDGIIFLFTADYFRNPSIWPKVPPRFIMPIYPLLVFLTSFFTRGDIDIAGRWANMLIGVSMIMFVYRISRRLFDKNVGLISAVLISIDPLLIRHSSFDRSDLLFSLMTLVLAYFFWIIPWENSDYKQGMFFGFLLGISQLTRPNASWYFLLFIIYWVIRIIKQHIPIRDFIIKTFIPVFSFFLVLTEAPYIYLRIIHYHPKNYFGQVLLGGFLIAKGVREREGFQLNANATDFIAAEQANRINFSDMFRWEIISTKYSYALNYLYGYFNQSIWSYFHGWIIPVIIMLIFYVIMRKKVSGWNKIGYLFSFSLLLILLLPLTQVHEPYLLPLRPIAIIILSWFLTNFFSLKGFGIYGKAISVIVTIAIIFTNLQNVYSLREQEAQYINGYRYIGQYLKEVKNPGDAVMARNNSVFFYARMQGYPLPSSPLDQTIKFCHFKGIKYLVFGPDERRVRRAWEIEINARIKMTRPLNSFMRELTERNIWFTV